MEANWQLHGQITLILGIEADFALHRLHLRDRLAPSLSLENQTYPSSHIRKANIKIDLKDENWNGFEWVKTELNGQILCLR
jgi:hypothetical protein